MYVQVTALLRRMLPEVSPLTLAHIMEVPTLPPTDFSIASVGPSKNTDVTFDCHRYNYLNSHLVSHILLINSYSVEYVFYSVGLHFMCE